jgi:hypothetical protein
MSTADIEVDYIDGERVQNGSRQFHVHWKGFPITAASWETRSNLRCQAKVEEYVRRRREQHEREQAEERRRLRSEQQQHQTRERSRRLFPERPPGLRCAPIVPEVTGQRIRVTIKREHRHPKAPRQVIAPIDFPRFNIAETRFSNERDYEELFQGMESDQVPIAIIGRRKTRNGEQEYEVRLGDSGTDPIWVSHDTAVKLCPSLVTRYLLGTFAAKLGID